MPTNKPLAIRTFQLYPAGASFVDVPRSSTFLHISRHDAVVTLHCLVDPNEPIEWKRICPVASVDYLKVEYVFCEYQFISAVTKPSGDTILYFLDPKVYDAERQPITPQP